MAEFVPPDVTAVELPILHLEPDLFVVVNKPTGLLAVPGRGPAAQDCVVNRLREQFPAARGSLIAHRLDMDTSGLMVVPLTPEAQRQLSGQFERREVEKSYVALLAGEVTGEAGTIRLAFRLDPDNRPYQIHDPERGKLGETDWRVLTREPGATRISFAPRTGRTHQLRLHAAHPLGLGCPILGDRLYGDAASAPRLMLHANGLALRHPVSGASIRFVCSPPF